MNPDEFKAQGSPEANAETLAEAFVTAYVANLPNEGNYAELARRGVDPERARDALGPLRWSSCAERMTEDEFNSACNAAAARIAALLNNNAARKDHHEL